MQCQSCGTQYPDNFRTCPNCGAPAPMPNQRPYNGQPNPYNGQPQFNNAQQNPYNGQPQFNNAQQYPYGNPYAAPNQVPQGMSKHDFYHSPLCKKYRGNIIASSVIIYICVGINLLLIAFLHTYTSLILQLCSDSDLLFILRRAVYALFYFVSMASLIPFTYSFRQERLADG